MTISTLKKCRYELHFTNMWEKAKIISSNIKTWINDDAPEIEFKEPCLPRGRTSVQDQDLESYYRVKFFYMRMDEVIGELTYRFQRRDNDIVCALGEICLGENATVEQFDAIANYYNLNSELLQCDHRLFKQFLADYPDIDVETASDLVDVLFKHELITFLPQLSLIATIFTSIPATSSTAERSFSTLRRVKSYLRSTMGQTRVSSLAIINIERSYANRLLQESMDRIIDIFGKRNNRDPLFSRYLIDGCDV